MSKRRQKFPNQTVERLTALRGILNMHERAIKARKACKLNGVSRKWDMGTWDCGSAACALGSAGLNPWFKERGLVTDISEGAVFLRFPNGELTEGCEAGEEFFGITFEESESLFSVWEYESFNDRAKYKGVPPAMVRARVDELIEKYSKESP